MDIKKKKKKTIPLSKRERKRYILIEVLNCDVNEKDFYFGFWIDMLGFFGSKGIAEISPKIVFFKGGKAIIKCKRGKENDLIGGMAFIQKIKNSKVIVAPMATSGTIKKLKERMDEK